MPSLWRFFKRFKKRLSRRKEKGKRPATAEPDDDAPTVEEDTREARRAVKQPRLEPGFESVREELLGAGLRRQDAVSDLRRGVENMNSASLRTAADKDADRLQPATASASRGPATASAQSQGAGQNAAARNKSKSVHSESDETRALRAFTSATKAAVTSGSRRDVRPAQAGGRTAAEGFLQAACCVIKRRSEVLEATGHDLASPREEESLCQLMNLAQAAVAESRREDFAQTRGDGGDGGVDTADGGRLIRAVASTARAYVIERTRYIRRFAALAERAMVLQAAPDAYRTAGGRDEVQQRGGGRLR